MTEETTRKGQKLTNFLLENAANDSNKFTMDSDAHLDSVSMPMSFVQAVISGIGDHPLSKCAAESNVVSS